MIFRQLFDQETGTYTYLIGDEASRTAALVDPVLEQMNRDLALLRELGLTLKYNLETHVHADHVTAAAYIKEATGCQTIVPAGAHVSCADRFIIDHETIQIGAIPVQAISTPGHTDSHMTYLVNNDRVLTGDALLIRGCGRTDFQNGNAGTLYESVTSRLFTLPDATLVYPAHDYRGFTVSTIGEEKKYNPRFAGRDQAGFIEFMKNLGLPMPRKIMEAVPANERCGRTITEVNKQGT